MRKLFIVIAMLFASVSHAATPEEIDACSQGVRAAYEAYLLATDDAKYPEKKRLMRALDFRLSQQAFAVNELHAYKALGYIAEYMRKGGYRAVREFEVAAVAGDYAGKECRK